MSFECEGGFGFTNQEHRVRNGGYLNCTELIIEGARFNSPSTGELTRTALGDHSRRLPETFPILPKLNDFDCGSFGLGTAAFSFFLAKEMLAILPRGMEMGPKSDFKLSLPWAMVRVWPVSCSPLWSWRASCAPD